MLVQRFLQCKKSHGVNSGNVGTQVLVVTFSDDWLPALVGWKELGSSPNLWFSEALLCIRAPQSKVCS